MDKTSHLQHCETYRGIAETLAKATATRGLDPAAASKLARKVAALADRELKQVTDSGEVPLACAPGCHDCCQIMPTAAAPEIVPILERVCSWPKEEREGLRERLSKYVEAAEPHRAEGFLRFRRDCPFLADGLCAIYEVRPLFCRGLSSENPDLCRAFNEDPNSEEVFGPNGELGLAQAIIGGLSSGAAAPQMGARLEVPRTILDLLQDPGQLSEVLHVPKFRHKRSEKDWLVQLPPKDNDILAEKIDNDGYWMAIDQRRRRPFAEVLHLIEKPTTANALAQIFMPSVFNSKDEMDESWLRFEASIDGAQDLSNWDPREAFRAIADFRPIGAAYQPHSMTESMRKIGKLIHDRIAMRIRPDLLEPLGPRRPGKLRVGLLGDFADRSGANWALGWVRGLDRQVFEVTVLKDTAGEDAVTYRFKELADHFYHLVRTKLELLEFVRSLDLDYLIYPELGDSGERYHYAMFRLARRQATAWGCPFTSGLPTIDYYLSGNLMEREDAELDYTEKLVRLPNTGLTLEQPRTPKLEATRARFGLPEGFLVSFPQYLIKWLPESDHLLADISRRVENPIVFFDQGGVPYERDVFMRRLDQAGVKHFWLPSTRNTSIFRAILGLFDVTLDSPGWSGGLTGMHALSVGTPMVTLPGPFLRQRLATSFTIQAGARGLVAKDEADYVDLVTSPERLQRARSEIRADRIFLDEEPLRALEQHITDCL